MKVAIITEGLSEYQSLPKVYDQLTNGSPHTITRTLKINVAPDAAPAVLARECKSRLLIAAKNGADIALVVLDREGQEDCPGAIAGVLETALNRVCSDTIAVRVVLKDRAFENWLAADLDALKAQPKRFKVTNSARKKVEPNKADRIDGLSFIKSLVLGGHYDKVSDSAKILGKYDVLRAAANSRSLRHLLHVLEHPEYSGQCRQPQAGGA